MKPAADSGNAPCIALRKQAFTGGPARREEVAEGMAYTAVQEVRNMAGQNIDAKLEAIRAEIAAQGAEIAAIGAKTDSTRWMLGAVLALLATLTALGLTR